MQQTLSTLQKVKTVIHTIQALCIFIAGCITIAVFTGKGSTDGRSKWFFAVCWLSIPALIYLVAVPMWTRAENVAKSLWFAIVDILYTIFWLSAFAAVLAWLRAGILQGAADKKLPSSQGNCTTFAYGSEKQCTLSYAASSIGVIIFILFIASSIISVLYVLKSRKDPAAEDPWLAKGNGQSYAATPGEMERGGSVAKDPIWNTDLEGRQEEDSDDERGPIPHHETDEYRERQDSADAHPGRPVHWEPLGAESGVSAYNDTEYRGSTTYHPPSAMSPTSIHTSERQDTGDYGRGRQGAGYSFR